MRQSLALFTPVAMDWLRFFFSSFDQTVHPASIEIFTRPDCFDFHSADPIGQKSRFSVSHRVMILLLPDSLDFHSAKEWFSQHFHHLLLGSG